MTKTSVMWFRRDLRLADNTALSAAVANSDHLALVFIIDPNQIVANGSVNQSAFFASVSHFKSVLKEKKSACIFSQEMSPLCLQH
ncbi:Deoxyribodipyrimidine photolyase [Leuconostoc pseudomesenteroides 4882]|nr:Deoxyribodipyrimidine photolyase [Leuconostoc pseudomesenteroides 4882]